MQFKKTKAILAAVLAAATTASATIIPASAAKQTHEDYASAPSTYAKRFLAIYDDVVTNGQTNGYLSSKNVASGGFGVPYHAVEELMCEAPDYGHETTSEAMSYIVWIAAMHDNIAKKEGESGKDLAKAWATLEQMIPSATDQNSFWSKNELSAQVCKEYPKDVKSYPSTGSQENVGINPIHSKFTSAYQSEGREYLMHWLADVDDWYGFGGSSEGSKGKFTFINTFQRGDQESCFETIPHPCTEDLKYGDSQLGMKFAFAKGSTAKQWSYTNAPDAEDRAIQAVYAANRWGVGDTSVSAKAAMMGDECRNNMFDKYYKAIGCQSYESDATGGGLDGQHFLMSWYTAWGGAANGDWAWQIGCSHSHQFYQNPLAAYGLLYDKDLSSGMKAEGAAKDYTTSLQRQLEMYLWLQSADGPFAGGCTNCYNGDYSTYPSGVPTFYKMAYIEHPVYADPGSNHWTGNQFWATQRLAELYYLVCKNGDASDGKVTPGGLSIKEALKTVLDKWVEYFVTTTKFDTAKGDFEVVSSLDWTGAPADWSGTYKEGANSSLKCSIAGTGNTDLGCANSLANTLIYYAAANGVEASGEVKEGTSLPEKALYTAQRLMDLSWYYGRDSIGMSRTEHNGSLARIFDQEVYIPSGVSGKYPYGYEVSNGAKFIDLRPMYKNLEYYTELETAWKADVANGAKLSESLTGTDCSKYVNVAEVDLDYHRFWHIGDVMMALGTMAELYPDVTPLEDPTKFGASTGTTASTSESTTSATTESSTTSATTSTGSTEVDWGDANCSGESDVSKRVTVADAILVARVKAEDTKAKITDAGKANADVNGNDGIDDEDLTILLQYLAGIVKYGATKTAS